MSQLGVCVGGGGVESHAKIVFVMTSFTHHSCEMFSQKLANAPNNK